MTISLPSKFSFIISSIIFYFRHILLTLSSLPLGSPFLHKYSNILFYSMKIVLALSYHLTLDYKQYPIQAFGKRQLPICYNNIVTSNKSWAHNIAHAQALAFEKELVTPFFCAKKHKKRSKLEHFFFNYTIVCLVVIIIWAISRSFWLCSIRCIRQSFV